VSPQSAGEAMRITSVTPAQANAVAHAPSSYDPLKSDWSQPEVAMRGKNEGGHRGLTAGEVAGRMRA
jgi:hypothetical protein